MANLNQLRKDVQSINLEIVKLLAKRNSIVKKIGKYKKENKLQITDKKLEKKIFSELNKKSDALKLNKKFVNDVFKRIVKESKRLQK
jgi:chorismate mutase